MTISAKAAGLFFTGMVIVFIMQNRAAVSAWLRGAKPEEAGRALGGLRRLAAETWHLLAILLATAAYLVWAFDMEGGLYFLVRAVVTTLVALTCARLIIGGLRIALRRGFGLRDEIRRRFPGLEARADRYVKVLQRAAEVLIYVAAGLVLLDAWGIGIFDWLASDDGRFVVSRLASLSLVLVSAAVIWDLAGHFVERYMETLAKNEGASRSARASTLLPLMRKVLGVTLATVVTFTILSELGVNIGPLLASAGVVGIAIGFGAQSLVKDVITGTFILLEDAISVGDVVELGGRKGLVEGMSIRSIRLRDLGGNVHLIPFGEVSAVLNMTKDYSFALMDIGVAYREDVDEVIGVLREIAAQMQADKEFGPLILEPLEVLGLDTFGDSAVNIRIRFKTLPIKQWIVKREFQRRMKRVFDEKGIEIPFPHQTIYFGVDKAGKAPPARFNMTNAEDGPAALATKAVLEDAKSDADKPARDDVQP